MDDLAILGNQCALDDFVVPIDRQRLVLLVDHRLEERQQVLRIEPRRIDR